MTNHEYAVLMYQTGYEDGRHHWAARHEDEPEYAVGYAAGERETAG